MPVLTGIAVVLMGFGGLIALANWLSLYQSYRTGRSCSPIPFVGAIFLGSGMLILPETRPFAWVALILDFSTLFFLIAVPKLITQLLATSRFNLLEEYVGEQGNKSVQLRLFRKNISVIKQSIRRNPGDFGMMELSMVGTWKWDGNRLHVSMGETFGTFELLAGRSPEAIVQISGFQCYEDDELSLSGIELVLRSRKTV